jgi:hypothetical protein
MTEIVAGGLLSQSPPNLIPRTRSQTQGTIHHQNRLLTPPIPGRRTAQRQKWPREGQHQQDENQESDREQKKIPKLALLTGAFLALKKEAIRAEPQALIPTFKQEVQDNGNSKPREACQKQRIGKQEAHVRFRISPQQALH